MWASTRNSTIGENSTQCVECVNLVAFISIGWIAAFCRGVKLGSKKPSWRTDWELMPAVKRLSAEMPNRPYGW